MTSNVTVASASLTLAGPTIDANGFFIVNSAGSVAVAGSNVTAGALSAGASTAGTLLLSGAGSSLVLDNAASFSVVGASNGAGTVVVDASNMSIEGQLGIAASASGSNTFGRFTVRNGGVVTSHGNLNIGTGAIAGQIGIFELIGPNSSFSQTVPSVINLGSNSNSAATISLGTTTSFGSGTGLFSVNPTGFVDMAANSLLFTGGDLLVKGGFLAGPGALVATGSHKVTVQDAGTISIATNFTLGSGGTLSVASGGSFSAGSIIIGNNGTGVATINGASSRFRSTGGTTLGLASDGTMVFSGGAVGTLSTLFITRSGGSGSLIINGASINSTGAVNIATQGAGLTGTGLLQITNGSFAQSGPVITAVGTGSLMFGAISIGNGGSYISGTASTSINPTGVLEVSGNGRFIGNGSLIINGGFLNLTGTADVSAPNRIRIINNGTATHAGSSLSTTGTLEITSNGTLNVGADGHRIVRTGALQIDTLNSQIDLADNTLIVDDIINTPATAVRALLRTGYSNGLWNGNGIASFRAAVSPTAGEGGKTALGYGLSSVILGPSGGTFAGQSIDNSAVIVHYTYAGDANLDGQVNLADLLAMAQHWNTSNNLWTDGDFNYDGVIDVADLNIAARNWQVGVGSPLPAPPLAPVLTDLGLPQIEIPEPFAAFYIPLTLIWRLKRPRRYCSAA